MNSAPEIDVRVSRRFLKATQSKLKAVYSGLQILEYRTSFLICKVSFLYVQGFSLKIMLSMSKLKNSKQTTTLFQSAVSGQDEKKRFIRSITMETSMRPRILLVNIVFAILINNLHAQNFDKGFPFYLPADDTTSTTFLPDFPIDPIEGDEFVTIENGHFAVNGERIRFFGTNATTGGAFPNQDKSAMVAGRLRKIGMNLLRFHHIDNGWSRESLFEWGQDTRHLNPETLDRLEKFIYELKRNGVYINLNLHVSRTVKEQDGVAVADSIRNFGKGVTYFDPHLLTLHKEYATQILTHVNPYTGMALKDDPVMAMVEITNENSLYRMWRGGNIRWQGDGGDFPMYHVRMLDDLWTDYLLSKYGDTETLTTVWNQGLRPAGEDEQIRDGIFETETINRNWVLEQHDVAKATMSIDESDPYEGNRCAKIEVSSVSGTGWHIQWKQVRLSLEKDSLSTVTFAAKADAPQNISVGIQKDTSPWTGYYNTSFQLTTDWQVFQFSFRAADNNDKDTRLSFHLGGAVGTYWFDDIHLGTSGVKGVEDTESLEEGTVRRIAYHECVNFSDNRVRDMSAFYKKIQDDYFVEMATHIKGLGVKVPLSSTNWNVGPVDMAIQGQLDYTDNHAYWDHPSFPNQPWSPTDWNIHNRPMVRDAEGGTIPRLFGGLPVEGKPVTMSEYNHPFPNRYQSEGVLFLTGYSAFHDTDAPMFFDYGGSPDDWSTDKVSGFFGIHRNTAMMGLIPSCALAFRTGMIQPAKQSVDLAFSEDDILLLPKRDDLHWTGPNVYPKKLALQHRVQNIDFESAENFETSDLPDEPENPYKSDTEELVWDTGGLFQVVTEKFVGLTGFLQDYSNQNFGALKLISAGDFATLTWVTLDDNKLVDAEKSLLTLSTTVQNTDMVWDGTNTVHNQWGKAPTEMRADVVELKLFMHADSLRIYTLDATGAETGEPRIITPVSNNRFDVVLDQNVDQTMWWGLEKIGLGTAVENNTDNQSHPDKWELGLNYPNPFNASTSIPITIPEKSDISVKLFDLNGRLVNTLVHDEMSPGNHIIHWDGKNNSGLTVPSGVYIVELKSEVFRGRQKIVMTK